MGKRGPPPKPTALRELEGNPSNRPLPENEPKAPPAPKAAQPPKHLCKHSKAEWKRLYPILRACGLMSANDLTAFAVYCSLYGRWVKAEEELAKSTALLKTPNGHVQPNPWITIARQTAELMKAYLIEFGMTPAARSRIGNAIIPPSPPPKQDEPPPPSIDAGQFGGLIGKQTVN